MKITKPFIAAMLVIVSLLSVQCAFADNPQNDTINTASVVADTLKALPQCLHYKVVGVCFWLRCSIYGCDVEQSLKLDHYLPDAVVTSYTNKNNNPWWMAQHTLDPALYQAGKTEIKQFTHFTMGFGDGEHNESERDTNNKFHEVDVIGNPALSVLDSGSSSVMLRSSALPYVPYYSSLLDAYLWRFRGLERFYPGSLIPGLHDIGTIIIHDWGSLYPRNGYVNQPDDAKAGAVAALRASTIVTDAGAPHIYNPLSNSCGVQCNAHPVEENSTDSQFQMIYPKVDSRCRVFGQSDMGSVKPWGTDASTEGHNRYVWVLWRHYHGCVQDSGATYIGSVGS